MPYSPTADPADPVGKTPLYRLAIAALQTAVFQKFYCENPPEGWFYTYPGICSHFQLPESSDNEHLLDDLWDTGKITKRHTKKVGRLCKNLSGTSMDYQEARKFIIFRNLEEAFEIWADAIEELWHVIDFTKTFHDVFLHDIDLCFPKLINRYLPIDHPDPLQSRLFAAREWVQLSRLDEDGILKLCEQWAMEFTGMRPPKKWVQESYVYYWAVAKAQNVEALQELDDIQLAITQLSNPEVTHAGTIPAPDPPASNPRFNRQLLEILKKEVTELEQVLENDAWVLLGRQAEARLSTSAPSLPEHLRQLPIPSNARGTASCDIDMERLLLPGGWYNDEIINTFGNRLNGLRQSGLGSIKVFYANSFYSKHVYDGLCGASRDIGKQESEINKLNTKYKSMVALLPSMDYLFIPTHSAGGKHWFSILVDFRHRTICSYDSLGPSDAATSFCIAFLTHMSVLGGESHAPHHWKLNIDKSFPIQQNQNDCGPSVCVAMFKAFCGESLSSFNTSDMPTWRESIASYLSRN